MSTTDQLPEPELGYIKTDKSNQPAFSARQMREAMQQARTQVQGEPMAWLHWLHGPVRVFMNKDEAMMELARLNREYPVDSGDRKMRPLILGDTAPQPAQAAQADVTDEQIAACVKRASTYGLPFVGLLNPGGTPSDFSKRFTAEILALRPEPTMLTGCKCRWDGDTQVEWCDLHLAHKEAIHEWAERAKEAEKQLALRPERMPMTVDDVDAECLTIIGHLLSRRERDRIVWRMAEAHHGIKPKKEQS